MTLTEKLTNLRLCENRPVSNQPRSQGMRTDSKKILFAVLVLLAALAGCAGGGKVETAAPMGADGGTIAIEASSFNFSPNEIRVGKPGPLAIQIRNVSGSRHNFTLKDPKGKTLTSVDLPPRQNVKATVELFEPGVYPFYCDKTFHSALGMNGQIIVGH